MRLSYKKDLIKIFYFILSKRFVDFKMVKKVSQNFIVYHGCGSCYYDGTNRIVAKNRRCINPTYNPFWKKTNDVRNKVETRAKLKLKSIVTDSYIKTYLKFINEFNKKKDILVQKMNQLTMNLQMTSG